jgi:malate permease and related proteins
MLAQLIGIFYTIVLPIILLAGIGWGLQRLLGLDMATLKHLNFYFLMPAMVYYAIVTTSLTLGHVAIVVAFTSACLTIQGVVTYAAARLRRIPTPLRRAVMMTTMFHNAGNYALPLQDLAFSSRAMGPAAMTYQALIMITQNMINFTLGILIVSGGRQDRHWRENLLQIVKFPPLYALAAGLITVQIRIGLGDEAPALGAQLAPLWEVVLRIKDAFIAVALLTLGAQLALVRRTAQRYPIKLSVVLRLLVGPAIGLGVIYAMGLGGFVAQVFLISMTTPTAVNAMLLCLEFDNHPDFAARAVFYATLLSPLTVTLFVFLAQSDWLPGFAF